MGATEKQIDYILKLIRGRHDRDAYREIGRDMGASASAAQRRATAQDASRTIDRLKSHAA
jgi:hypothetical protein